MGVWTLAKLVIGGRNGGWIPDGRGLGDDDLPDVPVVAEDFVAASGCDGEEMTESGSIRFACGRVVWPNDGLPKE